VAFLEPEQSLFVLDEPTANLDPPGLGQLHDLLGDLKRKGATIVFSSHLLRNALVLADRVGVIVAGEMVEPEEVPAFEAAVTHETAVRVVLSHLSEAMITAVRDAGGRVSGHNGREVSFTAEPQRRLQVIRAIEQAGGTIEEFHTEAPDWEALIRGRFHTGEER
jgi:ABC-2 type transport system ATP-binding protein